MLAQCTHPNTELRCRTFANQTKHLQRQCRECGESVGGAVSRATLTPEQIEALPMWDDGALERYRAGSVDTRADDRRRERERRKANYQAYLRSDKWRAKRTLVMEREGGICQGCQMARADEVHHKTYAHVEDELLFELVALCSPCHRRCHFIAPWDEGATP